MAVTATLHHGEGVCETAESCRDIARKRKRVFILRMAVSAGIDEIEGGEEGGQIGAASWGLVLFLFLNVMFNWRVLVTYREVGVLTQSYLRSPT
jgi:hypothetical protein